MSKKPRNRNEGKGRTATEFGPRCDRPVEAPAEQRDLQLTCPACKTQWTVTTHGK